MRFPTRFLEITIFALAILLGSGCGTTVGNGRTETPSVNVEFKGYTALEASVSSLKFCIKHLKFKADEDSDGHNFNLNVGEVTVDPLGTTLTEVDVPNGTYTRIQIDIDHSCDSGKAIQVTNTHGTFTTTEQSHVVFNGTFILDGAAKHLKLNIQPLVNAFASATSNADVHQAALDVRGEYDNED